MRTYNKELLNEAVAATTTLDEEQLDHMYGYAIQVIVSDEVDTGVYDVQLQISNDGENFVNQGTATNVTAATSFMIEDDVCMYKYLRLVLTKTSGGFTFNIILNAKGI